MRLKITLKSDLCVASGAGFSSVIDTDACFDRYGLPYIPARRLKGCLRAAAEFIELNECIINKIFGTTAGGFGQEGTLRISDACLNGYKALQEEIAENKISPDSVISLFSDIRSATAIEGDTAKKNSLRFTRVVSRYSPFGKEKELEFYSDVELDDDVKDAFISCCSALRNIGYKRNRGLGSVICTFCENESSQRPDCEKDIPESFYSSRSYKIDLTVKLRDDLMLPQGNGTVSIDYIPGTMLLGALAAKYTAHNDENKPEDFNNIFLSGNVSFGNLYVCDEYGVPSFPAPLNIGREKESQKILNMFSYNGASIVKPLKNSYISPYAEAKVTTKTVYHHSRAQQTLYTQECIEAGQVFSGTVICFGEYAKCITELLSDGTVSFGRSKNAQYSCCDIIRLICKEAENETVTIKKSEESNKKNYGAVVLRSDLIVDIDSEFKDNTLLGLIFANHTLTETLKLEYSSLLSGVVSGYNSKWNLKRPHCSCIKAGSVLIFSCSEDTVFDRFITVGLRCNEGFGRCEILDGADEEFKFETFTDTVPKTDKHEKSGVMPLINAQRKKDDLLKFAIEASVIATKYQLPNPALVGRATLMAKEALLKSEKQWEDFEGRVSSIKSEGSRESIKRLVKILNGTLQKDKSGEENTTQYSDCEKLRAFIYYMNIIKYHNKCQNNTSPEYGGAK